jgi:inosine/xanthosine triphosphate pyrophosphatase family protein
MRLLIGTTNPAKFNRYKTILSKFAHLELLALTNLDSIPEVIENGQSAAENARQKAFAYASATHLPALSVDESLLIPAWPSDEQPGVNVRRYLGFPATDEQLLEGFLAKIRPLPEEKRLAVWTYAINLSFPDGREFYDQVELTKKLILQPSLPLLPGYPLSSIQVDLKSGKSLRDLSIEEEWEHLAEVYEKVANIVRRAGLAG